MKTLDVIETLDEIVNKKEDKKIEKLDNTELYLTESQQRIIVNKINEIIEVLNKCG